MLKPDSLDSLFSILHEITLVERKGAAPESPSKMQLLEKYLLGGYLVVTVLLLLVALAQYMWPGPALAVAVRSFYIALVLIALGYLLSATFNEAHLVWRGRKQRFPWLLAPMRLDLQVDAGYLAKLMAFDKPTLKYALLQYRYRFDVQDGRISSLVGDVRKLGLFPAMVASTIAASTLLKNDSNILFWMWIPLILAACFYPVAFYLYTQRERPQQVIDLLELAIAHVDTDASPSKSS